MLERKTVTNEHFHQIFQENPLGVDILFHLHGKFVLGKNFDKDPYVHAYNAGMAAVVNYITTRSVAEAIKTVEKENPWSIE